MCVLMPRGHVTDEEKKGLGQVLQELGKASNGANKVIQAAENAIANLDPSAELIQMNLTKLKETCELNEEVFTDGQTMAVHFIGV